jgi:uncharacterized protein (TIRG00374 family)
VDRLQDISSSGQSTDTELNAATELSADSELSADADLAVQSRTLRNGLISLAVFFLLLGALLTAVPSLRSVAELITDANAGWVGLAIALELLSCAGYVVLFGLVFGKLGRHLRTRLPLAELAVNSVVSVSGMGGLALGAWVLRSKGVSVERIAKRSVLLFVLTSAVNVAAVAIIGIFMWLGLLPGSRNALLTLLPALLALATIVGTLALASWARRRQAADGNSEPMHGRMAVALAAVSGGVGEAVVLIRERRPRLLGSVGYWLFDNLALYACLAAFAHPPAFWAVAMAYLVGMLANSLPIPAGLVVVEGGLVGMLVLFGVRPVKEVFAAVVVYRVVSLWVPAIVGTLAFLSLQREIGKPLQPAGPAID